MSAIFVTGTDTGVGKTVVTKTLIEYFINQGEKVAAMKPVAAGAVKTPDGLQNEDAVILQKTSNLTLSYSQVNPLVFEPPIAPHIAAKRNNTLIDIAVLDAAYDVLRSKSERVIIEGAGGWQVPLTDSVTMADWVCSHRWPVILVVGVRLGCINHATLTIQNVLQKGNACAGWVANMLEPESEYSHEVVESLVKSVSAPLLGTIPHLDNPESVGLTQYIHPDISL